MRNLLLSATSSVGDLASAAVNSTATTSVVSSQGGPNPLLQNQQKQTWGILPIILLSFLVMYFLMIRPQKKKEKEAAELRAKVDIGDEIVTIGGIIGTVVSVKDDFVVIETSGDRNKLRISRWAIQSNNTAAEAKHDNTKEVKK